MVSRSSLVPDYVSRLDIHAHIRRTSRYPSEENQSKLDGLREMVTADFAALDALLSQTGLPNLGGNYKSFGHPAVEDFDDLDDDEADDGFTISAAKSAVIPVEDRQLPLPSYQNAAHSIATVELRLRHQQADELLESLRVTIADKSFQYSHVIRVAPRKSVKTRARSTIAKLNEKIAANSIAYRRCREAMERLGAGSDSLLKFQRLDRSDVKASSALVDPNHAGASTLRLSWIWHNNLHFGSADSAPLLEC